MATSAFKSTTKRTPIGASPNSTTDESSSSANRSTTAHRRSRSLSRFSRRVPAPDNFPEQTPRSKFVNKGRGSEFPEISLDDLAMELFDSSGDRGRSALRNGHVSSSSDGTGTGGGTVRRGRSVSRQGVKGSGGDFSGGGRVVSESNDNPRRRRSVSVVRRYQISDSESDLDHSQNSSSGASLNRNITGNSQMPLSHRPTASNNRPLLRRSVSQKDLKYHDGYSSQSSALTDDEGRDAHSSANVIEKTIRAVYAQKKLEHPTGDDLNGGLYEAMRKELRHAVEEIRMELEQSMAKTKTSSLPSDNCLQSRSSDGLQAATTIRRNHPTKLEQRKQDLSAEKVLEEQRGRELSKNGKHLLRDPNNSVVEKPSRARKRSNDRTRMSKRLTEEAEKYFENFISNVEDTDISSLDGERSSDTSSQIEGTTKTRCFQSPAITKPRPVDMDGLLLPWLQWETTNDGSAESRKTKSQPTTAPKDNFSDAREDSSTSARDLSYHSTSSRGSWSPAVLDGFSLSFEGEKGIKYGETGSYQRQFLPTRTKKSDFDMDEYLKLQSNEDFLFERLSQQQRINSGGLLLCNRMFF